MERNKVSLLRGTATWKYPGIYTKFEYGYHLATLLFYIDILEINETFFSFNC